MKRLALLLILLSSVRVAAQTYNTSFPLTENPISENGKWKSGFAVTGIWADVRTAPGQAFGREYDQTSTNFTDSTAVMTGTWNQVQAAEATIYTTTTIPGFPVYGAPCYPEVELRLLTTIAPGQNITGYEIDVSIDPNANSGQNDVHIVRWEASPPGAGHFTDISTFVASSMGTKNGDRVRAVVDASGHISAYLNGVLVTTATDTTFTTGSPGIGFNAYNNANGCTNAHPGFTMAQINQTYGFSQFSAYAPAYAVADCQQTSVNNSINGPTHTAVDGDTILVPAGTCTWGSAMTITKAIGIIGSGASNTTINDHLNVSQNALFMYRPTTAQISASIPFRVSGFTIQPLATDVVVSAAINAQGACNTTTCTQIRVDNNVFPGWASVTKQNNGYGINVMGDMFGVIDHNTFNGGTTDNQYNQIVEVSHASFPNSAGNGSYGDSSWNQPEGYGSANFLFIEDNTMNQTACCENEARTIDYPNEGGARVVLRFNNVSMDHLNAGMTWHGTESNGRPRGGRAWEGYANTIVCNSNTYLECPAFIATRSGTGLTWGNSLTSTHTLDGITSMVTNRTSSASGGWGACDGASVYDANDGTTYYSNTLAAFAGSGYTAATAAATTTVAFGGTGLTVNTTVTSGGVSAATIAAAGSGYSVGSIATIAGGDGSAAVQVTANSGSPTFAATAIKVVFWLKMIVSGTSPAWAANGWINGTIAANCNNTTGFPCSVHDVTLNNGSELTGNAANTLTVKQGAIGPFGFGLSDSIQVLRATACLDQGGGRGAGFLYSGFPNPPNTTQQVPAAQVASPAYDWANPVSNSSLLRAYVFALTARVVQNRDWFQDAVSQLGSQTANSCTGGTCTPFNGTVTPASTTVGVGYGVTANRPSTCTTGTGYWATDDTTTGAQTWNVNHRAIPGIPSTVPSSTNGALYICGAGGWPASASYIPYTYPHPLVGSGSGPAPPPSPTVSPTSVAFGSNNVGFSSSATQVTVTNNTGASLTLGSPYVTISGPNSADFTLLVGLTNSCSNSLVITNTGTCNFRLQFTPSINGAESGTATLNYVGGTIGIPMTGTGVGGVVTLTPTSLTFAATTIGQTTASQSIVLKNTGPGLLTITAISISGDFAQTNTCTIGSAMAVNATCTFSITFTPTQLGLRSGTLTITDNGQSSPQTAALSGTGTAFFSNCQMVNSAAISNGGICQ